MTTVLLALMAYGFAAPSSTAGGQAGSGVAPVDLLLRGGRIVTLQDPEPAPTPTAVAVSGGRIVWVGAEAEADRLAVGAAEVIDLHGAVVVPGLSDGHAHLSGLGKALSQLALAGGSPERIAEQVRAAAADCLGDGWLEGRGWDQNEWSVPEFPHRRLLDEAAPGRPVLLRRVDGHAAWVSSAALARAGITRATPDPAGGRILRDAAGEPTGVLVDNAVDLVGSVVPAPTREERIRRVKLAVAHCLARGLTGVHDAGVDAETVEIYRELAERGELGLRLYVMLADDDATLEAWLPRGPWATHDSLLTVRAVKMYADGALGSRGARLLADYADDPGNRGLALTSRERLIEMTRRAARAGFQLCTHAIGDAANREILDVYEQVLGELRPRDPRWRVEHAQVLAPEDLPRFARLGVVASMQPVHCTSDMDWAAARLGEARARLAYAWRSLLDSGARLCWGTDFPVEAADPLRGLYAARTRRHPDGSPPGGWHAEQTVDARVALALYTAGPAWAAFAEDRLGEVAPGRWADLTVLSGDPLAVEPAGVLELRTLLTVVGGSVRFRDGV